MIRKSNTSDTEKILQIWLEGSKQAHNFIKEDYWVKMLPLVRKYYLPNTDSYVFEDKHQIKGFISTIDDKYVGALFVDPKYQRKKIGSKLMKYIKNKHSELTLKVFCQNQSAIKFYQKNGFKLMSEQIDESTKEKELLLSWAIECKTGYYKRHPEDS